MMKSSCCNSVPLAPEDQSWLSHAGQLEILTLICREKVVPSSSVPHTAPFQGLQGDKILPSWDSLKLYFRDCQQGATLLQLHSLKPDQTKTFQPQIHIPTGGTSPLKPALRVPLKFSSTISSKAGRKNPSSTITDPLRNPLPAKADDPMLLKPSPGHSLAAASREITALLNKGQYCPSIIYRVQN